jgi:baculoviral IAP repeat-containing protein 6
LLPSELVIDSCRILIAGPEGTPYENGLFEFDLWCTAEFPYKPPRMFFRGAQGAEVWFNPYLHMDGVGKPAAIPGSDHVLISL